ncbi:MAG TPA: RIP metalloprotease RseP [Bacteroidetes bacterium]|nr:RIP metalloprotease RseP [Bacteroidota bacterium]
MEILIRSAQFILSLSILIVLHEFGHFLPAKLFKTKVEKFYLFFDYKFSLFKKKIGDTVYGIGWIPLGGYVKIAGMIDESMDKEQMAKPPQPWEFRTKPAWQRLIIMVGGVTVNFILGAVIYIGMLLYWGEPPKVMADNPIKCVDTLATNMGLVDGDKIIRVDDEPVVYFKDIVLTMLMNEAESITIDRNGEEIKLEVPFHFNKAFLARKDKAFIVPGIYFILDSVIKDMNAYHAGFMSGDKFVALNGERMIYFDEYRSKFKEYKGEEVDVTVLRGGYEKEISVKVSDKGIIGVTNDMEKSCNTVTKTYGFFEAIPAGIDKGYYMLILNLKQFGLMFSAKTEGYKHMGGFISIAKIFQPYWDWYSFWSMTALLSILLGIMNLLPIPALDGGHVMFLLYEMITGKVVSDKIMEYAQVLGFVIILSLLLYANGLDVVKLFQ